MNELEAKKLLDDERLKRETECKTEIEESLRDYNCMFDPVVIFKNGKMDVILNLKSKD